MRLHTTWVIVLLATAAAAAHAAPTVQTGALARSEYDDGVPTRYRLEVDKANLSTPGAVAHALTGCATPSPKGTEPCAILPPPPSPLWYQIPSGEKAIVDARSDFLVNQVRTYASKGADERRYFAQGQSRWTDDIRYLGLTAGPVTFEYRLHAAWNDLGRFVFNAGFERVDDDADGLGYTLSGLEYNNCRSSDVDDLGQPRAGCDGRYSTVLDGSVVFLADNDDEYANGMVDLTVSFTEWMNPDEVVLLVGELTAYSDGNGAELDAYGTARLTRVSFGVPGASISAGSGTVYPTGSVETGVPEPASAALVLVGLALVGRQRRASLAARGKRA